MTHELSIREKKKNFLQQMADFAPEFKMALPPGVSYERLHRVTLTAITRNPDILKCTPKSIIGAVLTCAQLGLVPDGVMNEAHFVPFWNKKEQCHECTLIPGYKGLEGLCLNTGNLRSMISRAVYSNDIYAFEYGSNQTFKHIPAEGDRGEFKAAYDVATFNDGSMDFLWMWKEEIDKHKNMSPTGRKNYGTWVEHYEAMALKTVKRVHAKQLPMSAEAQRAVALDELAGSGISQNLAAEVPAITDSANEVKEEQPDNDLPDFGDIQSEFERLIALDTVTPEQVDAFFNLCDPGENIKTDADYQGYWATEDYDGCLAWIYRQYKD